MIRIFKRRRPEPIPAAPSLSIEDLLVARWWGYTKEEWAALPVLVKVDKREGYFHAWQLTR